MKQSPHSVQPRRQHEGFAATAGRILFLMNLIQEFEYFLVYSHKNSPPKTTYKIYNNVYIFYFFLFLFIFCNPAQLSNTLKFYLMTKKIKDNYLIFLFFP